jgi:putative transposase
MKRFAVAVVPLITKFQHDAIAMVKPEIRKIARKPIAIVNKLGEFEHNGANHKAEFNKGLLDNSLGQLTSLINQKASVQGRELISVSPKDLPDELKQRTEKCCEQLQWSRAVYLTSFSRRYRAWAWELTPGESTGTLNQEPPQGGLSCDAGTTSNFISESIGLYGVGDIPEIIPLLQNQSEANSSY